MSSGTQRTVMVVMGEPVASSRASGLDTTVKAATVISRGTSIVAICTKHVGARKSENNANGTTECSSRHSVLVVAAASELEAVVCLERALSLLSKGVRSRICRCLRSKLNYYVVSVRDCAK